MITNVIKKNNIYKFTFKDNYPALINSIRRVILKGFPVYKLAITKINKRIESIEHDDYISSFKHIYISNNRIINMKEPTKVRFKLYVIAKKYTIISTKMIKFFIGDVEVKSPLDDIYLFTMNTDEEIDINGKIILEHGKVVSSFGYSYDDPSEYDVIMNSLGIYKSEELIKMGIKKLLNMVKEFKKFILSDKEIEIKHGYEYNTDGITKTVLNLISEHMNSYKNNDIVGGYIVDHVTIDQYIFRIEGKNKKILKDLFIKYIDEVIKKIKLI